MAQIKVLAAGTVLDDRYVIDMLIGKGGAGAVYRATDLTDNKTVAVKILISHAEYGEDSILKQKQFFQREVALLQRVSHPNIIRVIDSGIADGELYLVMEYVQGDNLKVLMKSGTLTLERSAQILLQIGSALQAIHDQGIIHRDFKPHNVLIAKNGEQDTVKLLDFGIAKMIRGNSDEAFLQTLTAKGVIAGTLHYMSPEQCQGGKLDERTDIYSMGITAYEMVAGRLPFDSNNPVSLIMQHLDTPPPPLKMVAKEVEEVVLKALAKAPEERYSSALEFAEELAQAIDDSDGANQMVILVDGSSPTAETQTFDTLPTDDAPTLPNVRKKTGLWDTVWRKLKS